MKTLARVMLGGVLLMGCGAPTVAANRAEFSIFYAGTKSQVAVWLYRIKQGCVEKKISAETCAELPSIEAALSVLDEQAKAMLRQADKEVDWATIGKYAELALSLAAKTAL